MKIKHGFKYKKNGWTYISITGEPYERGVAHGTLLKDEIKKCLATMEWNLYDSHGLKIDFFKEISNFFFKKTIEVNFPELFTELKGIAKGAVVNLDELILWNNLASLDYALPKLKLYLDEMPHLKNKYGHLLETLPSIGQLEGGSKDKCSAFMALGDYTSDGKICCAHNSFDNFIDGQNFNIILDMKPSKGHRMLFQCAPGYISSQTDFFINSKGFIGTETTIGGFNAYKHGDPITCRIRHCMQYANTLDEYVEFLKKENSGDYANSWLIGDTKRNEIMRIELGLEFVNVEKKKNGYFIGFNAPYDPRIRNLECVNSGFDDIRRHQGARKVRLEQLMEKNKGKLNIEIAQQIIADHYDVYLNKINLCSRTVCSHYELDDRAFMSQADRPLPYQPRGAVDGCVANTDSCKNMGFYGRWGSSCGTPFVVKDFIKRNKQWYRYEKYLDDRPSQPWTHFTSLDKLVHSSSSKNKSKTSIDKRQKRKHTVKHNKDKYKRRSRVEERNTKKNTRKRK
tara:strand:- start:3246 stop:4778 length:1533 start_codon:yes stop_codon:yes gene_type:complete